MPASPPDSAKPETINLWPGEPHEMIFRFIRPGRFRMGDRGGVYLDEEPVHWVNITQGFWMTETPVTKAQYRHMAGQCVESLRKINGNEGPEPSEFKGSDQHPVKNVSWHEARSIGKWLTRSGLLAAGLRADLSTEAQWEYACRAGTATDYHTGDGVAALAEAGWFEENAGDSTHPVREKTPNDFGLYDMHGNVWEWCLDAYNEDAYKSRSAEPENPHQLRRTDPHRVIRGGSGLGTAEDCRSAFRNRNYPDNRHWLLGFRLCLSSGPVETRNENERSRSLESQARAGAQRSQPANGCPKGEHSEANEPETEVGGTAGWSSGVVLPPAPDQKS